MPRWVPEEIWKDREVFIIGGGDSLRNFAHWQALEDECTIGCNSAFIRGEKICKVLIFGDARWFDVYQFELEQYEGTVFTNAPQLQHTRISWLWTMPREIRGLHRDALGWNRNTGAAAINLALLLGASSIYLLGYDMKLGDKGRPNWHDRILRKPNATNYPKFLEHFLYVARDLKAKWPNVKVINVTDDSALDLFPKVGVDEFFNGRK